MALNPLSVIRVPSPRGAGEKSAEIARPGPGARHDGNHWGLNRVNWAHGFYPESRGKQFSMKTLERQAMEEVAIAGGVEPEAAALMPLEELLVLPDIQTQLAGGISSRAVMPISPLTSLGLYEVDGPSKLLTANLSRQSANIVETRRSPLMRGPVKIVSLAWSINVATAIDRGNIQINVEGVGQLANLSMANTGSTSLDVDVGEGIIVPSGSVQAIIAASGGGATVGSVDASVAIAVVPLRRV